MVNAGLNNFINEEKVVSVVDFTENKTAPIRRAINEGKKIGLVIDVTEGRPTNSVIFMENGYIILSSKSGPTMTKRIEEAKKNAK